MAEAVISSSQEEKLNNVPGWGDPKSLQESFTPSQQRLRATSQPLGLWTLCGSDGSADDDHTDEPVDVANEEHRQDGDEVDEEEDEEGGSILGLQSPLEFASPDTQLEQDTGSYNPCFESDRSRSLPASPNSFKVWNVSFTDLFGAKMVTQSQLEIDKLFERQPASPLKKDVAASPPKKVVAVSPLKKDVADKHEDVGMKGVQDKNAGSAKEKRKPLSTFRIKDLVKNFILSKTEGENLPQGSGLAKENAEPTSSINMKDPAVDAPAKVVNSKEAVTLSGKQSSSINVKNSVMGLPVKVVDSKEALNLSGKKSIHSMVNCVNLGKQAENSKRKSSESVMDVIASYSGSLPECKPEDPDFLTLVMSAGVSLPLPLRDCRGRLIKKPVL